MSDEREKLIKRIEHWAEHNDEHTNRYEESAEEAKNIDLPESAQHLLKAAEAGRQVSIHLRNALKKINKG
jgi:3-methyladenine DNA glycosylase AlkC